MDAPEKVLFSNMEKARARWERATADLTAAMDLVSHLPQGSPDGTLALRNARQTHNQALTDYSDSVKAYADKVLRRRNS